MRLRLMRQLSASLLFAYKFRRKIIRVHWRSFAVKLNRYGSLIVGKDEIHQVSKIPAGQPFLQPLRHEREFGSLHRCDLRTRDDHLDAQGLTNGDAAG